MLFEPDVDRFPDQPQRGSTVVQCVRGASETGWSDISTLFLTLLQLAQERVRITTAYFVPDTQLNDRICAAAERGVDVQILLPGPHADKRFVQLAGESSFERLLDCGVKIWKFQPSMLHAKIMTVDGVLANIGSANLNARSTELDEEVNLVAFDAELVRVLDAQFDEDLPAQRSHRRGTMEGPLRATPCGRASSRLVPSRDVTPGRSSAHATEPDQPVRGHARTVRTTLPPAWPDSRIRCAWAASASGRT